MVRGSYTHRKHLPASLENAFPKSCIGVRRYAPGVTVAAVIAAFLLLWAGSALILDRWLEWRRRPSLYERLAPYMPTVADEAEDWLRRK